MAITLTHVGEIRGAGAPNYYAYICADADDALTIFEIGGLPDDVDDVVITYRSALPIEALWV